MRNFISSLLMCILTTAAYAQSSLPKPTPNTETQETHQAPKPLPPEKQLKDSVFILTEYVTVKPWDDKQFRWMGDIGFSDTIPKPGVTCKQADANSDTYFEKAKKYLDDDDGATAANSYYRSYLVLRIFYSQCRSVAWSKKTAERLYKAVKTIAKYRDCPYARATYESMYLWSYYLNKSPTWQEPGVDPSEAARTLELMKPLMAQGFCAVPY